MGARIAADGEGHDFSRLLLRNSNLFVATAVVLIYWKHEDSLQGKYRAAFLRFSVLVLVLFSFLSKMKPNSISAFENRKISASRPPFFYKNIIEARAAS